MKRSFEQYKTLFFEKFPESTIELLKFDGKLKILVNSEFGECSCYKKLLLKGIQPSILTAVNKTNYFINILKNLYNDRFDYSQTEYINYDTKIKLICKEHGIFEQRSDHLLNNISCPKCGRDIRQKGLQEHPAGWSFTAWEKCGNISKKFESFKVYVLECWNETEHFYKIGKTFTTVERRFQSKYELPYNWKIIKIFEGDSREISKLEIKMKKENKEYKYLPLISFAGKYECFNNLKKLT